MTRGPRQTVERVALTVAIAAMVIFTVAPLAWIVLTSFKPGVDALAFPPKFLFHPTLENYRKLFASGSAIPILLAFRNSLIVTALTTLLALLGAAPAAYSLSRLRPPGAQPITIGIIGVRMLPPIVLVVPLFQFAHRAGLQDTLIALLIPYVALTIPLATWMMYGFFLDLPRELEEAALVDGCTRISAFWRVILPLAAPGLAATAIFTSLLPWNDLVFSLPLTTVHAVTLPVIASRVRVEEGVLWGQLGAVASLMIIPVVILTFLVQRHIVRGITAGAVKG